MKLFDKIRILRKARGLSQEQLGYSLSRVNKDGISRQTVSDWENGKFEPKLENIRDLAEVFNVTFDALLDESVDLDNEEVLDAVLNKRTYEPKEELEEEVTPVKPAPSEKKTVTTRQALLLIVSAVAVFLTLITVIQDFLFLIAEPRNFMTPLVIMPLIELLYFVASTVALLLLIFAIKRNKKPTATVIIIAVTFFIITFINTYSAITSLILLVQRHTEGTKYSINGMETTYGNMIASYIFRIVIPFIMFLPPAVFPLVVLSSYKRVKKVEC